MKMFVFFSIFIHLHVFQVYFILINGTVLTTVMELLILQIVFIIHVLQCRDLSSYTLYAEIIRRHHISNESRYQHILFYL